MTLPVGLQQAAAATVQAGVRCIEIIRKCLDELDAPHAYR